MGASVGVPHGTNLLEGGWLPPLSRRPGRPGCRPTPGTS
ncbi:hypothetical protein SLI_6890 [Streptomyces lividans 1326]|uniref:Uncharacterized protein n=1 Tax=Streptomyces lividans 1326 TaxID=1200984 RepID=A0A7U9HEI7_STRLI|nr:hypothetical protein SLI_6890 [Streptomyces lividans 1326]